MFYIAQIQPAKFMGNLVDWPKVHFF